MSRWTYRLCPDRSCALLLGAWLWLITLDNPVLAGAPADTNVSSAPTSIVPPQPVSAPSSIQFFRRLLAMSPEEREQALATKTPAQRSVLLAKVSEYQKMPELERDLRLRLLQRRLYLLPLMRLAPVDRGPRLEAIPQKERQAVEARLKEWDKLFPDQQAQVLQNETNLHYFLYRGYASPALEANALAKIMPPKRIQEMQEAIARWRSLHETQQQRVARRLDDFLALDGAERQKMLRTLPEEDRLPIEQISQHLITFSPDQRASWVDGFKTFASLSPDERRRFILQAERWQNMSREEQQLWRSIVARPQSQTRPRPPGIAPPPGLPKPSGTGP